MRTIRWPGLHSRSDCYQSFRLKVHDRIWLASAPEIADGQLGC